tara:strand:- start:22 stop:978 length:957 start_codon:yes stop_codon:yes gene_type:complete
MVTGASTSQAAIMLVDARNGVIEQTSRHFYINNLLRVKDIIVAVNKMDLVHYSEDKFNAIKKDILRLSAESEYKNQNITFIPISALKGDNVVDKSIQMDWYNGETLLAHLEAIDVKDVYEKAQTRFPVQTVIRPKSDQYHDFRGYAGKLYGGDISVGDEITVLPSLTESKVKEILFFNESFDKADRGSSVTITLENDVNVSRGDMIVKSNELPNIDKNINATVCWMNNKNLQASTKYILKHGVNTVLAQIQSINGTFDTNTSKDNIGATELKINDIGRVEIKMNKALYFDSYETNKSNGSFILVDPKTNETACVGFIN